MRRFTVSIASMMALMSAGPAWANGGVELPEPSSLALFGIGALGLAIGRRFAVKRGSGED